MVEFFSKSNEPRREDAHLRKVLQDNRATIVGLADQFSRGAYSASRRARAEGAQPQTSPAAGPSVHALSPPAAEAVPRPHVRISANGRVVVMDLGSGRQLHHLGDLRRSGGEERFRLATRENGFFSPLDADVAAGLADLDGRLVGGRQAEADLKTAIAERLAIEPTAG
jgi:hypothetical protein